MKLSEKIIELRKANGMTQEELAVKCNVSRQSISKWEADIALPETEKLLILAKGATFILMNRFGSAFRTFIPIIGITWERFSVIELTRVAEQQRM